MKTVKKMPRMVADLNGDLVVWRLAIAGEIR